MKNCFYRITIKNTSSSLKKEKIIGKRSFIFFSPKNAYKFGKTREIFNLVRVLRGSYIILNTICRCKDKDIFSTKIPICILDKKKFTVKSTIKKSHLDIKTPYKVNTFLILEFYLIEHVKTLKQANIFFKNIKKRKLI